MILRQLFILWNKKDNYKPNQNTPNNKKNIHFFAIDKKMCKFATAFTVLFPMELD